LYYCWVFETFLVGFEFSFKKPRVMFSKELS